MATGSLTDIVARLRSLLPRRWFPDDAPVLEGTLAGQAAAWSAIWGQIEAATSQTRIATMTGPFLDLCSADFFAADLPRLPEESDNSFRSRIQAHILRPRGTRAAVVAILTELTGHAPVIIEPWNTGDCGGWDTPGFVWDTAGCYGDLNLPWQMFVVAYRPVETLSGVNGISGWDSSLGGWDVPAFALIDSSTARALPSDADIYATIHATMPAGTIAWVQLQAPPVPVVNTGGGTATAGGHGAATVTLPVVAGTGGGLAAASGTGLATVPNGPPSPSGGLATASGSGLGSVSGQAVDTAAGGGAAAAPSNSNAPADGSILTQTGWGMTDEAGDALIFNSTPNQSNTTGDFSGDFTNDF